MKNLFLLFVFTLSLSFSAFSQTETSKIRTNEIGIDMLDLAFFRAIDVSYEYIKKPEFGFGLSARYCFDNYDDALNTEKYSFTPFFRYYFFNKRDYGSKGFYAESFLKFFGGEEYNYIINPYGPDSYDYYYYLDNYFEAAFGVGVGFKYVSHKGFVLDLNIGGGRSFGVSDISPEVTGRACIMFGYRF